MSIERRLDAACYFPFITPKSIGGIHRLPGASAPCDRRRFKKEDRALARPAFESSLSTSGQSSFQDSTATIPGVVSIGSLIAGTYPSAATRSASAIQSSSVGS